MSQQSPTPTEIARAALQLVAELATERAVQERPHLHSRATEAAALLRCIPGVQEAPLLRLRSAVLGGEK